MKKFLFVFLAMFIITSCSGWFFQQSPYPPPTPFLPLTNTPAIVSPTPGAGTSSATPIISTVIVPTNTPFAAITNTPFGVVTATPSVLVTDTPGVTATAGVPSPSVNVEVLGCNTSIDVTHGMGEVTNAFVILKNTGNVDLTNINATLNALDEGRVHPDKTVEIALLPVAYQITIKLTVDSTYQQETPIQIEVNGDGGLFQRVGESSCKDIGLFAPKPEGLLTPVPVNP